eukprot:COSAG06_NODE_40144_length_405_cov_0.506536_2_plen_22_part_01
MSGCFRFAAVARFELCALVEYR